MVLGTNVLFLPHVVKLTEEAKPPLLVVRNLLDWQLLLDPVAREVPWAQLGELLNIVDVLESGGLGVPGHNVGKQSDLLAGAAEQVLQKAWIPGQYLVPEASVLFGKIPLHQIGECTSWYIEHKLHTSVPGSAVSELSDHSMEPYPSQQYTCIAFRI